MCNSLLLMDTGDRWNSNHRALGTPLRFEHRQISNDLEGVLYVSVLFAHLPTDSTIQFVFRHH